MSKPSFDDAADQRYRLVTRETVYLSRSARKALVKYGQYLKDGQDPTTELGLYAVEVKRCDTLATACRRDLDECDRVRENVDARIAGTTEAIQTLNKALTKEQKVRRRKAQYDALAAIIDDCPSRCSDQLHADIAVLETQLQELTRFIVEKHNDYNLLFHALDDLCRDQTFPTLPDDNPEEERPKTSSLKRKKTLSGPTVVPPADEEAGEIAEDLPPAKRSKPPP